MQKTNDFSERPQSCKILIPYKLSIICTYLLNFHRFSVVYQVNSKTLNISTVIVGNLKMIMCGRIYLKESWNSSTVILL